MVQDTYQNGVGSALFVSDWPLVAFYPILRWFTYAWFIQGPPKPAQVNPRFSQVLQGSPRFSQVLPGSPRKFVISCDFVGFPGFPGRSWVLFSMILWVSGISWENLGVIFCDFRGFPGIPGRTWVETVGDGPGRAAS